MGPLNQKISLLEGQKNQYLQQARQDINSRRAMHNSQIQQYDQEIKPLKHKAWVASVKDNFRIIGQRMGKMGPM